MSWKSAGAVLAGVLFVIIITTGVDVALHMAGVYPPGDQPLTHALALLATAYRIVIGIAGGWLTARLAPAEPMRHALRLGYLGTGLALVGLVGTWNMGLGPRWYPLALVLLAIPQCWVGGRLYVSSQR